MFYGHRAMFYGQGAYSFATDHALWPESMYMKHLHRTCSMAPGHAVWP